MTSPLVNPIAEALYAAHNYGRYDDADEFLAEAETAAGAVIAVVAALPEDYTAADVLAHLRGEDVPSEPLPVKGGDREPCVCACGKPAVHLTADPDSDEWACRVPKVTS